MIILPESGYDKHIGVLISQMNNVRDITFNLTTNLTAHELDYNIDNESNSIGTLLFHIAAVERYYQFLIFSERFPSNIEMDKYKHALPGNMNSRNINNNDLSYYISNLNSIRDYTLIQLKSYDDVWLFKSKTLGSKYRMNNSYMIRHFIDDELSHQGQIKWILKKIKKN